MLIKKMKLYSKVLSVLGKLIYAFLLLVLLQKNVYSVSANSVFITDVTPVSFTVTWVAAESASGSLEVFSDVRGNQPVIGISIVQQYTDSSNTSLATEAALNGILRSRVTGLLPDTPYFFRLTTVPTASNTAEIYPASGPLPGLTTQVISSAISNDAIAVKILKTDGMSSATGAVLIAQVSGSRYPVSKMLGDTQATDLAADLVVLNLSNIYDSRSVNRQLNGGESLALLGIGGRLGRASSSQAVPVNNRQGALKDVLASGLILQAVNDSDGDGLPDWYELENGLSVSIDDANIDTDGDGLSNILEYQIGSNLNAKDTDQDGIEDAQEVNIAGTSAVLGDTDQDGIDDNQEAAAGTDPLNHDSDGDGFTDGAELAASTNPLDRNSFPIIDRDNDAISDHIDNCVGLANPDQSDIDNDGLGDACDADIDGDNILNPDDNAPAQANPLQEDGDSDGFGDLADNCPINYNPAQLDTDADGEGNACDRDDDNDGVNDYQPAGVPSDIPFKLSQVIAFTGTTLDASAIPEAIITISKFDKTQPEGQRLTRLGVLKLENLEYQTAGLTPLEQASTGDLFIQVDASGPPCNCIRTRDNDTITLMTDQGEISIHLPASNLFSFPESLYISTDGSSYDAVSSLTDQLSTRVKSSQENIPLDNCRTVINTDQSDIDNDGLGDVCDISEEDLDGDGILNGVDNCPGAHNISQIDTDGDAQGDACDPDDDNDGLSDINEVLFGSDPLQIDSDNDGIDDAKEDFDFDGIININEIINATDALVADGRYAQGLNYFHYPYSVAAGTTAFSLLTELGGETRVQKIQRQNSLLKQLETAQYIAGAVQGSDFPITSGEGYLLLANQSFNKAYNQPVQCTDIKLSEGLNLAGFSCVPGNFSAFDALEYLGGENVVSSIQRLNTQTGLFETATYWRESPAGVDFTISNTQAYLIHAKQDLALASPVDFPVFKLTSLTDGQIVNTNQVLVSGTIADGGAAVRINGQNVSIKNGVFSLNLVLAEGDHTLDIDALSTSNLRVSQRINIKVAIPPVISIESHTDGEIIAQNRIMVFGRLDKPVSRLTVNGNEAVLSGNTFRYGYFCTPFCERRPIKRLVLVEGENIVTIQATGINGGVSSRSITLNHQPLVVNALNPGTVSTAFEVTIPEAIASVITEYSTSISNRQYFVPFTGEHLPTTQISQDGSRLSIQFETKISDSLKGVYDDFVSFSFKNSSGSTVFDAAAILKTNVPLSTQPPLLTIDTQNENDIVNYVGAQVAGKVGPSATASTIDINGVGAFMYTGNSSRIEDLYAAGDVPLTLGPSTISVSARGENNLVTRKELALRVEPIEFTIASGETYRDSSVSTKGPKGIKNIKLFLGNISLKNNPRFVITPVIPSLFSLRISEPKGAYQRFNHKFAITTRGTVVSGVYDMQLHWFYGVYDITMPLRATILESNDPPDISLLNLTDGETVPGNNLFVDVRVSNDSAVTLTVNGIAATHYNPNDLHDYRAKITLADGPNIVSVQATGLNGKVSTVDYSINVVPVAPPVLAIASHSEGDVVSDYREKISVTTDTVDTRYDLYINGVKVESRYSGNVLPAEIEFSSVFAAAGNQLIEIYARYYQDVPVASINLNYILPPPPEISITSHTQGQIVTSAPIVIQGRVANNVSGVVRINGIETAVTNGQFSLQHIDLSNGQNTIVISSAVNQPPFEPVVYNLELNYQDSLQAKNIRLAVGGKNFIYHEFTTTAAFWRAIKRVSDIRYVPSRPSGISTRIVNITKLSNNRVLLAIPVFVQADEPATTATSSMIIEFEDASEQVVFNENIDLKFEIVDEFKVFKETSIEKYRKILLTAVEDTGVNYIETITAGLPASIEFEVGSQSRIRPGIWEYSYSLRPGATTPPGIYTFDLDINFKPGQTSTRVIYNEQQSVTFEVLEKEIQPTVSITSHTDNAIVSSGPITVTGTLADPDASLSVNGVAATLTPSAPPSAAGASFSAEITLVEGINTINVQATGASGLVSSDVISLTLDTGNTGATLLASTTGAGSDASITLSAGTGAPFSYDLVLGGAEFTQVSGVSLRYTGPAVALNDLGFSIDAFTPVSAESKYSVSHSVNASATAVAGVYDLILDYTLTDATGGTVTTLTKTLSVTVQ